MTSMVLNERHGAEGKHSSESQKAHATGELVIVAKNDGHMMYCLASSLAAVVRLAGRQTKNRV